MLLDDVTSNFASQIKKADHCRRGGSTRTERRKRRKSIVLKILTCKLFAIKILQTLFANPAPIKPSEVGGRGVPSPPRFPKLRRAQHAVKTLHGNIMCGGFAQAGRSPSGGEARS